MISFLSNYNIRLIFQGVLFSILILGSLFASNGKIIGTVVQKSDGSPAIGVNIVIVDSYLGAASDQNGRFRILNIPPGT